MCKIGIGTKYPTHKLDIKGFNKIDTILIKLAVYIFRKRGLIVSISRKFDNKEPTYILYVDGNVGIEC